MGLYTMPGGCLVTNWSKERLPARGEGKHGVELAGMRTGEDEDDPLLSFLDEGVLWARLGCGLGWA